MQTEIHLAETELDPAFRLGFIRRGPVERQKPRGETLQMFEFLKSEEMQQAMTDLPEAFRDLGLNPYEDELQKHYTVRIRDTDHTFGLYRYYAIDCNWRDADFMRPSNSRSLLMGMYLTIGDDSYENKWRATDNENESNTFVAFFLTLLGLPVSERFYVGWIWKSARGYVNKEHIHPRNDGIDFVHRRYVPGRGIVMDRWHCEGERWAPPTVYGPYVNQHCEQLFGREPASLSEIFWRDAADPRGMLSWDWSAPDLSHPPAPAPAPAPAPSMPNGPSPAPGAEPAFGVPVFP
ncbi:MAG: hypothetical protein M1833_002094 [Piccolia ochrophora]|nr:MAG: hypothetical protein M1833_002094 [Piccolia ochrophora]